MKKILLSVFSVVLSTVIQSQTLTFKYDGGGNQVVRSYCDVCAHLQKSSVPTNVPLNQMPIATTTDIKIYPNPTKDKVNLVWSKNTDLLINKIEFVAYNFTQFRPLEYKRGNLKATIDLTDYPIGLYVVVFHLTNGEKLSYKILKH